MATSYINSVSKDEIRKLENSVIPKIFVVSDNTNILDLIDSYEYRLNHPMFIFANSNATGLPSEATRGGEAIVLARAWDEICVLFIGGSDQIYANYRYGNTWGGWKKFTVTSVT